VFLYLGYFCVPLSERQSAATEGEVERSTDEPENVSAVTQEDIPYKEVNHFTIISWKVYCRANLND